MTTPRLRQADAATTAETLIEYARRHEMLLGAELPEVREFLRDVGEAVLAGRSTAIPRTLSRAIQLRTPKGAAELDREVHFTAQRTQVRRLWSRYRIAYTVDPALWAELGEPCDSDVLPAGLFTHLPHPDPFVHFPEPLVMSHGADIQQVVGFFVTGRRKVTADDQPHDCVKIHPESDDCPALTRVYMCSTADPRCTQIMLSFVGLIYDRHGNPVHAEVPHLTPPYRDMFWNYSHVSLQRDGTVGEMLNESARTFFARSDDTYGTTEQSREDLKVMSRRALGLLLYLCTTNRDLQSIPARPRKARTLHGAAVKVKPAKVIGIGFHVGAQLRAWKSYPRHPDPAKTGGTKRPHVRRSHFHTYTYGPRDAEVRERRVKWLAPIPVKMGLSKKDLAARRKGQAKGQSYSKMTTVIPVGRATGAGR